MSARRVVAALLFAACCVATATQAQAPYVTLDWRRPSFSFCPSAAALQMDVEASIGRKVFMQSPTAPLQIAGTIEEAERGVRVHLEARDVHGSRLGTRDLETLQGACSDLHGAIVLALTLLIEHQAPVPRARDVALGFEGALVGASAPKAVVGAGPTLRVSLGTVLRLRLSAAYFWPVFLRTSSGIRATVNTAAVATRICPLLAGQAEGRLNLSACAGLHVGAWLIHQTRGGAARELRAQLHGLVELRASALAGSTRLELALAPMLALNRVALFATHGEGSPRELLYRAPPLAIILSLGFVI